MLKPFLSVVIPTLNEEKYLPALLSSLVSQTYKNFEVIVSDAKSEDKTKEKALEFQNSLDIKVYDSKKRNVSYQRNFGAEKARGDYLLFIDADHWAEKNFINAIVEEITKSKADLIIPVSIPDTKKLFWRAYFSLVNFLTPFTVLTKKPMGNGPAGAIKKDIFDKIGGYDESIFVYEDQYLFQLAYKNGAKVSYPKDAKVYFSIRRIEKDGVFRYFYTNIIASLHLSFIGPVRKKLFEYKMGGQEHIKS